MVNAVSDTGLLCLVALCRFHRLPVEPAQLAREFGDAGQIFDATTMQRAAKALGLRYRYVQQKVQEKSLPDTSVLPVIAQRNDGTYWVLAQRNGPQVLAHDLRCAQPQVIAEQEFLAQCTGNWLLLSRHQRALQQLQQHFDIRWFIPVLRQYQRLFVEVIVASFFLQLLALVTPLFFQVVMDKVLVHHGKSTLDVLALGFLAASLFEAILGGIRSYVFSHTTHRVDVQLGSLLYRHLLQLPLAYFQARAVGQSVARVRELDSIRQFITGSALTLCIDLVFTCIFIAVMLYYSVPLSTVVLLTIPAFAGLSCWVTPLLKTRLDEKFKYGAANQSFLVESISGAETVKSLALEPIMQRQWEDQLANYITSSFRAQHTGNLAGQCAGLINKLMTLGILWWGAQLVMRGELSVGQLVAFNMLAGRISSPILKLVQLTQDFQQAKISVERLGDILNTPCESAFNPQRSVLPSIKGDICFDAVRFRYRFDSQPAIAALTLHVKPGEIIGIVGKSGSGKSTLTKLLQRLYVPESGRVLVDGIDLATVDTTWLRRQIGVVLQNSFLFNKSIRENIAITHSALPIEAVIHAAQLAGAHEFIAALPQAYDSIIEEQGSNLSGGQQQRIAIARALIHQPRILIFDEATSALDVESERIIQNNMAAICKERTVFIIAHRLSTVQACDRIIVMDNGSIIEQGTHDALLKKKGHYAQMYRYQTESVSFRQAASSIHCRVQKV